MHTFFSLPQKIDGIHPFSLKGRESLLTLQTLNAQFSFNSLLFLVLNTYSQSPCGIRTQGTGPYTLGKKPGMPCRVSLIFHFIFNFSRFLAVEAFTSLFFFPTSLVLNPPLHYIFCHVIACKISICFGKGGAGLYQLSTHNTTSHPCHVYICMFILAPPC